VVSQHGGQRIVAQQRQAEQRPLHRQDRARFQALLETQTGKLLRGLDSI